MRNKVLFSSRSMPFTRTFSFTMAVVVFCALIPLSATAQTVPYSFDVDSFEVSGRGIFDDFNDGFLDPAWDGTVFGNAVESGGTLTLANTGQFGFLDAPLISESTVVSGQGVQVDFGGDFTATSVWSEVVPDESTSINLALGSINGTTGNVHQYSIGLVNATSGTAALLGGDAGLALSVLDVVRDSGPGNILSLTRTTLPVFASDVTGDIHLSLIFDDSINTLTAGISLDGGATTLTPFAAEPWNFFGGGFSLSAGSTVPEPGTVLLMGMGLAMLSIGRRSN